MCARPTGCSLLIVTRPGAVKPEDTEVLRRDSSHWRCSSMFRERSRSTSICKAAALTSTAQSLEPCAPDACDRVSCSSSSSSCSPSMILSWGVGKRKGNWALACVQKPQETKICYTLSLSCCCSRFRDCSFPERRPELVSSALLASCPGGGSNATINVCEREECMKTQVWTKKNCHLLTTEETYTRTKNIQHTAIYTWHPHTHTKE